MELNIQAQLRLPLINLILAIASRRDMLGVERKYSWAMELFGVRCNNVTFSILGINWTRSS
jgi:hypothetical protein